MYSRVYKSLSALIVVLGSALCVPHSLTQPFKPIQATADIRAGVRIPIAYTVEVAVPLASLGRSNPAGKSVGFDASVGIANAAGDRRERAAHWGGLSEAVVVDRPGSARLLPDTWGTLFFAPVPKP